MMTYPIVVTEQDWSAGGDTSESVWDLPNVVGPLSQPTKILPANVEQLPTGCYYSSGILTISGSSGNVILDGWDFRRTAVRVRAQSAVFTNCIFGGVGVQVPLWIGLSHPGSGASVKNCEFDGSGISTLFAGMIEIATGSSLWMSYCKLHNAPASSMVPSGTYNGDHNFWGAPGVHAPVGMHDQCAHVQSGSFTERYSRFDMTDGVGQGQIGFASMLFFEPFGGGIITDSLIEYCIFTGAASIGGFYNLGSRTAASGGGTSANIKWRHLIIEAGTDGMWVYPPPNMYGVTQWFDIWDFTTANEVTAPTNFGGP
jgi:hypothetical protein